MKQATMPLDFLKNMSIPSDMPESGCYMSIPGFKGNITRAELQALIDQARSVSVYAVEGGGASGGGNSGATGTLSVGVGLKPAD